MKKLSKVICLVLSALMLLIPCMPPTWVLLL